MKKIDIKGKEYVPVNERLKYFKEHYPGWAIQTEIVHLEEKFILMKATILDPEGTIMAQAHAYEREGSSFINSTSFVENCETSSVGRALGFLGIGIDTSIASFEEVANAINQQEANKRHRLTDEQVIDLQALITEAGFTDRDILKKYRVQALRDLPIGVYNAVTKSLSKYIDEHSS